MNDNQTCCAHSKVVLKHHDHPGGTRSDYWECDSGCGTRFYPETSFEVRRLRDSFAGMALKSNNGDTLWNLDAAHAGCIKRIKINAANVRLAKTQFDEAAKLFESSVMDLNNIHARIKVWQEEMEKNP